MTIEEHIQELEKQLTQLRVIAGVEKDLAELKAKSKEQEFTDSMIEIIEEYYRERTCGNCKHNKNRWCYAEKGIGYIMGEQFHCGDLSFGCNKFESKE
jgi:hypothetical protein